MNHAVMPSTGAKHHTFDNERFDQFLKVLQERATARVERLSVLSTQKNSLPPIFRASIDGDALYNIYLEGFSAERRQEHTCRCCKDFFRRYGNLVMVDPTTGDLVPLLFHGDDAAHVPEEYAAPLMSLSIALSMNTVVDKIFYLSGLNSRHTKQIIGEHKKGGFSHFQFELKGMQSGPTVSSSSYQNEAEFEEDKRMFAVARRVYSDKTLKRTLFLFETDAKLSRTGDKFTGPLKQFNEMFQISGNSQLLKSHRQNLISWHLAHASKMAARIKTTALGELMTQIENGDEPGGLRLFAHMTNPTDYMRPKAAPSSQTRAEAERIVAELGLTSALRRRALRRDELPAGMWRPVVAAPASESGGVFDRVQTKDAKPNVTPDTVDGGKVSQAHVIAMLLPRASKIEVHVHNGPMNFSSYTTAVDADAKPILKWDNEESGGPNGRNPVCSYAYHRGSDAAQWGLVTGWHEVHSIQRSAWDLFKSIDDPKHFIERAPVMVLKDGRDHNTPGLCLFPESLIADLHSVRSVIEAFSGSGQLEGTELGLAALPLGEGMRLRLTIDGSTVMYTIASAH